MANDSSNAPRRSVVLIISAVLLLSQQLAGALSATAPFSARTGTRVSAPLYSQRLTENQMRAYGYRNGTESDSFSTVSEKQSSRLRIRSRVRSALSRVRGGTTTRLDASDRDSNTAEKTWSGPVEDGVSGSRLGVRSRVKAVLKKAKSRTGISNASDEPAGFAIAEAASIGGLAEGDLVIKKNGLAKVNGVSKVNGNGAYANGNGVKSNGVKANGASANGYKTPVPRAPVEDYTVKGKNTTDGPIRRPELDVLKADVPVALPDPLPFKLPELSQEQKYMLDAGERVQEQSKMGREGSGYVVMDVKAPPYIIWECLLEFDNYPQLIKTVRSMEMFTSNKLKSGYHSEKPIPPSASQALRHYGIPSVTRAAFVLSKFKLNIAAIHNYRPHPDGHYMVFNLDPECTNVVLKSATGIWHTQTNPDGKGEDYTRVWLLCELKVSKLLPQFIVDYTAKRAMPRATNWLKPHVEPLAEEWKKGQSKQQKEP